MSNRLKLFIVPVVFCCAIAGFYIFSSRIYDCPEFSCVVFIGINRFSDKKIYERTEKSYRALYKNGIQMLRVESYSQVSPEQAKKFNEYKTMQLKSLFENAQSPYPGAISDEISCDKKYKPVFEQINVNSLNIKYYSGYLNDRLQYGSCIGDQLKYKSSVAMFYCRSQKKWYQLEFITPIGQEIDTGLYIIKSISCVNQPPKTGNFFP